MAIIKIETFGGMFPRTERRLLPSSAALVAANIRLTSGVIQSLHQSSLTYDPASPSDVQTIFLARNGTAASAWFAWNLDVDCVRVPLPTEVESRFCWTGDGVPKFAKYTSAISGGGSDYPKVFYTLGIPTPQTAATVTPSGGVGTSVTRAYQYTFFSQDGEESGPSPVSALVTGKIDDTWALTNMDTAPTNSGTGTAAYSAPSTTFTNAASAKHWLRIGDEIAFGGSATTYRTVTAVPSATSFKVTGDFSAETTWARRANWNTTGLTRRIYRTTGSTGAFLLVIDNLNPATTTYNDTITDANILGDELISVGWEPPPVGLKSLNVHSSGALVGFTGNLVCFSEPLQPHAWISTYQLSMPFDGVGIATYGSTVVVATVGSPYIVEGVSPGGMSGETLTNLPACLSKRSVISIGSAVLYASKNGLVSIGAAGPGLYTEAFYTRDEWVTLTPASMICATANGRLYVRIVDSANVKSLLVFDNGNLVQIHSLVDCMFADPASGELYFGSGGIVYLLDDVTKVPLAGEWRSKEFILPKPMNMGAARIDFDLGISTITQTAYTAAKNAAVATNAGLRASGKVRGAINARAINAVEVDGSDFVPVPTIPQQNLVTFSLYGGPDYALLASKIIADKKVFRLPAGYRYDNFIVQVTAQSEIDAIYVAETPSELSTA